MNHYYILFLTHKYNGGSPKGIQIITRVVCDISRDYLHVSENWLTGFLYNIKLEVEDVSEKGL